MSRQAAVRLPDETFERLHLLAQKTGRTATFYIREAIEEHLSELEDIYLAERALKKLNRGEDQMMDAEEFWNGLEN